MATDSDSRSRREAGWIDLFLSIVHCAFLGKRFAYKGSAFDLSPMIVTPYDFSRKIEKPRNEYERLLASLDSRFRDVARVEVYRKRRGWIAQGLQGYRGKRIREVRVDNKTLLLPALSKGRSIGVDSSSIEQKTTVLAFCFIPDYDAAYTYLERHLALPKTHDLQEFKWRNLDSNHKVEVLEKFKLLLAISCNAILFIETDAIVSPPVKFENIFRNLVEGCFSGYENDPNQAKLRPALREQFFQLANDIPIHCDKDFPHLVPDKAVRLFVQTLARQDGWFRECTPLFASLRSHESKPIQIADIIVGVLKTKIQSGEPLTPLVPLPFDRRKMAACKGRFAKAYYWFS